jgi:hypothetical protein
MLYHNSRHAAPRILSWFAVHFCLPIPEEKTGQFHRAQSFTSSLETWKHRQPSSSKGFMNPFPGQPQLVDPEYHVYRCAWKRAAIAAHLRELVTSLETFPYVIGEDKDGDTKEDSVYKCRALIKRRASFNEPTVTYISQCHSTR